MDAGSAHAQQAAPRRTDCKQFQAKRANAHQLCKFADSLREFNTQLKQACIAYTDSAIAAIDVACAYRDDTKAAQKTMDDLKPFLPHVENGKLVTPIETVDGRFEKWASLRYMAAKDLRDHGRIKILQSIKNIRSDFVSFTRKVATAAEIGKQRLAEETYGNCDVSWQGRDSSVALLTTAFFADHIISIIHHGLMNELGSFYKDLSNQSVILGSLGDITYKRDKGAASIEHPQNETDYLTALAKNTALVKGAFVLERELVAVVGHTAVPLGASGLKVSHGAFLGAGIFSTGLGTAIDYFVQGKITWANIAGTSARTIYYTTASYFGVGLTPPAIIAAEAAIGSAEIAIEKIEHYYEAIRLERLIQIEGDLKACTPSASSYDLAVIFNRKFSPNSSCLKVAKRPLSPGCPNHQ